MVAYEKQNGMTKKLTALLTPFLCFFVLFTVLAKDSFAQDDSSWVMETNIYQIFVDRFGRNLDGVRERLDYLKELGVKTIWLMPIFKAMSDHGYDAVDFYAIEPRYGDTNDLKELVDSAKEKEIKVILDLVINHIGIDHPWFKSSDPAVRKDKWFVWANHNLGWGQPWGGGQSWFEDPY